MMSHGNNDKQDIITDVAINSQGDYVIRKYKDPKAKLLRWPNRFLVADADIDQSQVIINSQKLEKLNIFAEDVVKIIGRFKSETYAIAIADENCPPDTIKMSKQMRYNANVNVGDVIRLEPAADIKYAEKLMILPFDQDVQKLQDKEHIFEHYIVGFFKNTNRPVKIGDVFQLQPAEDAHTEVKLPPINFKVVNLTPDPAIIATGCEIHCDGDPVSQEDEETKRKQLVGYSDLGGIDKQLEQIRELVELPLKHPEIFAAIGIDPPRGVLLSGPPGTGKTTIGRAISNETASDFFLINSSEIMSSMAGESEKNLRQVFEAANEAASKPGGSAVIFIDEIDVIGGNRDKQQGEVEKRVVSQLLTLMDGVKPMNHTVVIAATNRPNTLDPALRRFGRFDREIVLNAPDVSGRRNILQLKTKRMKLAEDVDINYLADNTQGFTGSDLAQLCVESGMCCLREYSDKFDLQDDAKISNEDLEEVKVQMKHFKQALPQITPSTLRETTVEIPNTTWADVGGLQEQKRQIKELVQFPLQYKEQYERLGIEPSRGALFFGPPGNGKTLLAKCLANECQTNFISVKGPELMSMWVGESERGVREIFDKARKAAPCILFMDEIDSIASKRGAGAGGAEGVNDRMLNQLLTELDGVQAKSDVFVIAATNRIDKLDPALIRGGRLDQIIYVGMPDFSARISILRSSLRKSKVAENVDLQQIAAVTQNYSGADLAEICSKAVALVVEEGARNFNIAMSRASQQLNRDIKNNLSKQEATEKFNIQVEAAEKQFNEQIITRSIMEKAVRKSRQSVSEMDLKQYEQFKMQYCNAEQGGESVNKKVRDFKFVDNFNADDIAAKEAQNIDQQQTPQQQQHVVGNNNQVKQQIPQQNNQNNSKQDIEDEDEEFY